MLPLLTQCRCYLTPDRRVWYYCRRRRWSRHVYQFNRLRFTQWWRCRCCCCCCCSVLFLFDSEKRVNLRGGKCKTQQKFCIWIVRSFVRSLARSPVRSIVGSTQCSHIEPSPQPSWRLGRVQCEENCLVVWWSHFYWFSIFSKDLCFMNAFSLSSPPAFFPSFSAICDSNSYICFFLRLFLVELLLANCLKQQN